MAFLLLLHEKMRLQRKVNKLTLRQTQMSGRKERISKNISKVQKMYSNKMTMLEKSAQMWSSQFKNSILNQAGLGAQNQMFNPMGGYGITSFVANQMGQILANGGKGLSMGKDADGNPKINNHFIDDKTLFNKMMQDQYAGGLKAVYEKDSAGNDITSKIKEYTGASGNTYKIEDYQCFQAALQQAQNNQSQAQFMCQQMSSQYESNVSIWLEAQKAQLEEEQNAALLPLEAQETEIDLDNTAIETELQYARERLKNIEQACSQEIQSSAPKFGLG